MGIWLRLERLSASLKSLLFLCRRLCLFHGITNARGTTLPLTVSDKRKYGDISYDGVRLKGLAGHFELGLTFCSQAMRVYSWKRAPQKSNQFGLMPFLRK